MNYGLESVISLGILLLVLSAIVFIGEKQHD